MRPAKPPGRVLALVPMFLLLTLGGLACDEVRGSESVDQARLESGRNTYILSCSRCHQIDGTGFAGVYPALAGNPIVMLHDPNPTIDIVLDGRGGMPGFRLSTSIQELADVITYIRNEWGNDASPVSPAQVR